MPAFETTLAARTLPGWLKGLRQDGYVVHLVYFWLNSADLAVRRVAERVNAGGHQVPDATIRQRYTRSLGNFFRLYRPEVSAWQFYDNSQAGSPRLIALTDEKGRETIAGEGIGRQVREGCGV